MTGRSRAEQIRALLDEADRVCRESEQVTRELERTMKREFRWPDDWSSAKESHEESESRGGG